MQGGCRMLLWSLEPGLVMPPPAARGDERREAAAWLANSRTLTRQNDKDPELRS